MADKVIVTKNKIDGIANAVATKTDITLPITIDDMIDAIANILLSRDIKLQFKNVSPSTEQQLIQPDTGYNALSQVRISAIQAETLNVVTSGTYTPTEGKFYNSVVVNIKEALDLQFQSKTVTPLNTSQIVAADPGYDALSSVTVNAIPAQYKDVSSVTATANDVLNGKIIVDADGNEQTGILTVHSYYIGENTPDASLGEDGDLYFEV